MHPAGNCHTTGKRAWVSNWLLFVISKAQIRPSGSVQFVHMKFVPFHHPYVIACDTGVKMEGNSANCPLQSWSTERDCITMD